MTRPSTTLLVPSLTLGTLASHGIELSSIKLDAFTAASTDALFAFFPTNIELPHPLPTPSPSFPTSWAPSSPYAPRSCSVHYRCLPAARSRGPQTHNASLSPSVTSPKLLSPNAVTIFAPNPWHPLTPLTASLSAVAFSLRHGHCSCSHPCIYPAAGVGSNPSLPPLHLSPPCPSLNHHLGCDKVMAPAAPPSLSLSPPCSSLNHYLGGS